MSASDNRSWDEMAKRLRSAAEDVRSALERSASRSLNDDPVLAHLKSDVSRLEQSASELISKISAELRQRRSEIDTSFDRERAQHSAEQIKSSLEELAALASIVGANIGSAASSTLKQSEPELKNVARALEEAAGSTASWIRAAVDPVREEPGKSASEARPPLDDL